MNYSKENMVNMSELAAFLGIKMSTLYAWVHSKSIPHYKIGRLVKFRRSEIDEWLEQRKVKEIVI